MKVALYGGTFDPIHYGHLITAGYVFAARKPDLILFVPANVSPFKHGIKSASALDRLNMAKIAISPNQFFSVTDYEIKKGGTSYTIDTVKHFLTIYDSLEIIIGYDNYINFTKWREYEEILKICNVIVLNRRGYKNNNKGIEHPNFVFLDSPSIKISSSTIREKVIAGESIFDLVTPEVEEYILKNRLYLV